MLLLSGMILVAGFCVWIYRYAGRLSREFDEIFLGKDDEGGTYT